MSRRSPFFVPRRSPIFVTPRNSGRPSSMCRGGVQDLPTEVVPPSLVFLISRHTSFTLSAGSLVTRRYVLTGHTVDWRTIVWRTNLRSCGAFVWSCGHAAVTSGDGCCVGGRRSGRRVAVCTWSSASGGRCSSRRSRSFLIQEGARSDET